jgi:hypothetical protein
MKVGGHMRGKGMKCHSQTWIYGGHGQRALADQRLTTPHNRAWRVLGSYRGTEHRNRRRRAANPEFFSTRSLIQIQTAFDFPDAGKY